MILSAGRKKKKITRTIVTIAAFVGVLTVPVTLTGCGSSSSGSKSGSASQVKTKSASEGSSKKSSSGKDTINLAVVTNSTSQWSYVIAKEKGIYKKYGLTVNASEFSAGIETVNAIELGSVDLGYVADFGGINRIGNTEKNVDIRFLSRLDTNSENVFYVNPKKIKKLEDLKGKKIITQPGTSYDYWNAKTLEAAGLKGNDAEFVKVESIPNSLPILKKGNADATWAAQATIPMLKEYGLKPLVTQKELNLDTDRFYVSSVNYIKNNKDTLVKFFKATKEAYDYMRDNLDESADIVYEKTGMGKDLFKKTCLPGTLVLDFKQKSLDNLNSINKWCYDNKLIKKKFDVKDYVDTSVIKEALPDAVDDLK